MDERYKFEGSLSRSKGGFRFMLSALLICLAVFSSCSKELTNEMALEQITEQDEFQSSYYAPMRIGELVLTGDNHNKSKEYIRKHYGVLIDAGLVEVNSENRNSWRTVIDVQLTSRGQDMSDERRKTAKEAYVQVCRMVPVTVAELRTISEGNIIECSYVFEEREITPFGLYKGFKQGREYKDKRTFVRARGAWRVK